MSNRRTFFSSLGLNEVLPKTIEKKKYLSNHVYFENKGMILEAPLIRGVLAIEKFNTSTFSMEIDCLNNNNIWSTLDYWGLVGENINVVICLDNQNCYSSTVLLTFWRKYKNEIELECQGTSMPLLNINYENI